MATAFVQNGAKVFIASRKEGQLKTMAEKLTAAGPGSCEYIVGDIGTKAGCDSVAEALKKRTKKLNVVINNSGQKQSQLLMLARE